MKRKVTVEFKIDESKAVKIAEKLLDLFYNRRGFFKDYSMPEYILPRNLAKGGRGHALYLTYVISIDYMIDAEKLWRNSRGAYELYPERFKPEIIVKMGDRTLRAFVRRLGARFSTTGVSTWKRISTILLNKYDGDPRNITRESLKIKEIKKRLNEFPYLRGNKLSNFYIRAMARAQYQ
jgi:hypothetical protein